MGRRPGRAGRRAGPPPGQRLVARRHRPAPRPRGAARGAGVPVSPAAASARSARRWPTRPSDAGADLRLGCGIDVRRPLRRRLVADAGRRRHRRRGPGVVDRPAAGPGSGRVPAPPPDEALAAAGRLRHRAMVLLYLVLDRPRWTEFDAHYFPGPEVLAARVSEPKNYRDDPDQPADRTVLCAEIACWVGDEIWSAADDDLAARLAGELAAAGPARADPGGGRDPPPAPRVPRLPARVRRRPRRPGGVGDRPDGLLTFGRQGLFAPDNTHHALAMGWAAADALRPDGTPTGPRGRPPVTGSAASWSRTDGELLRRPSGSSAPHRRHDLAQVRNQPHERPPVPPEAVARSAPRRSGSPWPAGRA